MDRWHLIRTAHHLGKLGTISATAKALGLHRATVLRHIDALEAELGVKLFLRGTRGYTPTEDAQDLIDVAGATEEQFGQLFNRLKQRSEPLTGEFIVTSLEALVPVLMPLIKVFQKRHPGIQLRYLSSKKVYRLEFGEAHVAVRTGARPQVNDNVVIPFTTHKLTLYAHSEYLEQYGRPTVFKEMVGHKFISFEKLLSHISVHKWILDN
ncbi:MAG: LysR family transcriptional regulator, partial [Cyanobacteria bacterium J06639_1]